LRPAQFKARHLLRAGSSGNVAGSSAFSMAEKPPKTIYIICSNPRSGSWLLSDALTATKKAGDPREWFNPLERQRQRALWRMDHDSDMTAADYLRAAARESMTANGVSGIKLHFYQLEFLKQAVAHLDGMHGLTPQHCLLRLFPGAKYIWLRRRDKIRQAVSLQIAVETNQWRPQENGISQKTRRLRFEPEKIAHWETVLKRQDEGWARFFHEHRIAPEEIYYEALAADYPGSIRKTLEWIGVDGASAIQIAKSRLRPISGALNDDWTMRYAKHQQTKNLDAEPAMPRIDGNPFGEITDRIALVIPDEWKRWIVLARAGDKDRREIGKILMRNGYDAKAATKATKQAFSDPYADLAVRLQCHLQVEKSLARVGAEVARIDPESTKISCIAAPAAGTFKSRFYAANHACVLLGLMQDWQAPAVWTPDYMRRTIGEHQVQIMTYTFGDASAAEHRHEHRSELAFGDLITKLNEQNVTPDFAMLPANGFMQTPAAQPLFADFTLFKAYLDTRKAQSHSHLSMTPRGFMTRLRRAPFNAFHAQVVGRTRYRLLPTASRPDDPDGLRAFRAGRGMDLRALDVSPSLPGAFELTLSPGEVLFVPVGWLHQAMSLDVGIALRFSNFLFKNSFSWK
jgi:trehalose 2-sulfotransferase